MLFISYAMFKMYGMYNLKIVLCKDCAIYRLLYEDQEQGLFNVTIFKKNLDDFKTHCRENRYVY